MDSRDEIAWAAALEPAPRERKRESRPTPVEPRMVGPRRAAWMFDIDGTLTAAWPSGEAGMRDWWDFENCEADPPNQSTVQIAQALEKSGFDLVFVTARPEKYRKATQKWLDRQGLWWTRDGRNAPLFMAKDEREKGAEADRGRSDAQRKRDLYLRRVEPIWAVQGVFEDRRDCALQWLDLGLSVFEPVDWRKNDGKR